MRLDVCHGAAGRARIVHSAFDPAKGSIELEYAKEPGTGGKARTEPWLDNTLIGDTLVQFLSDRRQRALGTSQRLCCDDTAV